MLLHACSGADPDLLQDINNWFAAYDGPKQDGVSSSSSGAGGGGAEPAASAGASSDAEGGGGGGGDSEQDAGDVLRELEDRIENARAALGAFVKVTQCHGPNPTQHARQCAAFESLTPSNRTQCAPTHHHHHPPQQHQPASIQ